MTLEEWWLVRSSLPPQLQLTLESYVASNYRHVLTSLSPQQLACLYEMLLSELYIVWSSIPSVISPLTSLGIANLADFEKT